MQYINEVLADILYKFSSIEQYNYSERNLVCNVPLLYVHVPKQPFTSIILTKKVKGNFNNG